MANLKQLESTEDERVRKIMAQAEEPTRNVASDEEQPLKPLRIVSEKLEASLEKLADAKSWIEGEGALNLVRNVILDEQERMFNLGVERGRESVLAQVKALLREVK